MGTKKIDGNLAVTGSITRGGSNVEVVTNKVTGIDSQSTNDQYPSAKAVYDEIQEVIETAEGKSASFVVSYAATVTGTYDEYAYLDVNGDLHDFTSASQFEQWLTGKTCSNSLFNSNNNTITLLESDVNSPTKYLIIDGDSKPTLVLIAYLYGLVKKGYVFLVTELDVADRWVSSYFEVAPEIDIVLSKMETSKIDLSVYPTKAGNETITGQWVFQNKVAFSSGTGTDYTLAKSVGGLFELFWGTTGILQVYTNSYVCPVSNNSLDLGTSARTFKDIYLSGTAYFGSNLSIVNDNNDNLRLCVAGVRKFAVGSSFNTTFTHIYPSSNTLDLGSSSYTWRDLYLSGTVYANSIRGTTYTGTGFDIASGANRSLGHLYPNSNDSFSLGANALKWKNLFLSNLINPNSDSCGISLPDTTNYEINHQVLVSGEDIDLDNNSLNAGSLSTTVIDIETENLEDLYAYLHHTGTPTQPSYGIVTFNAPNYPNLNGTWALCAKLSTSTPLKMYFWGRCLTSNYYLKTVSVANSSLGSAFLTDYYSKVMSDPFEIDSYTDDTLTVGDLAVESRRGFGTITYEDSNSNIQTIHVYMTYDANDGTDVTGLTLYSDTFNSYMYVASVPASTLLNNLFNNNMMSGGQLDLGSSSYTWKDLYLSGNLFLQGENYNGYIVNEGNRIKFYYGSAERFRVGNSEVMSTNPILPSANNTYDLGSSTNTWKDLYLSGNVQFDTNDYIGLSSNTLNIMGNNGIIFNTMGNPIQFNRSITFSSDNSKDIGASSKRAKDIYFAGSLKDGTRYASLLELYSPLNPILLSSGLSPDNEIKWTKMCDFARTADTTFTFETAKTGCANEYKAIIRNTGSSTITITLPSGVTIVSNDDNIVVSSNTFTLPAGTEVELNCVASKCAVINWQAQ